MHILAAIAEFERERIAERVKAGLQRARAQGKRLGPTTEGAAHDCRSWWLCARRRAGVGRLEDDGRPVIAAGRAPSGQSLSAA